MIATSLKMNPKKICSEEEVRSLRAICYGECSDKNWDDTKKNWMEPDATEFLLKHQRPIVI